LQHYWHFYQVVLEAMNDEDASLKERALRVLEKMLSKHVSLVPMSFSAFR
jgi:hypothetical protein